MGKTVFLPSAGNEGKSSPGVVDHGMMLNVSDRNLGDPSIIFMDEEGVSKVQSSWRNLKQAVKQQGREYMRVEV